MDDRKLLPVKSDVIFRLFFADERNQEFLTDFLKSVLHLPEDDYDEIEIIDPHLLREFDGDKLGIIDIKLRTKSRKVVHIEIQLSVTPEMIGRIVFYDSKLITEQIGSGNDFSVINKVISIVILDENLIANSPKYHHRFTFYDHDNAVELTDLVEIHTLELRKLPASADGTALYDWVSFIDAESEEELRMIEARNPQVGKAVVKFRELSADERVRDTYFRREMMRRDISAQKNWALKQQQLDIAKNLLGLDVPIEKIIKSTSLTREEVEALRQ
jgi:predicted transposase/invertase (TIGR01784 family)